MENQKKSNEQILEIIVVVMLGITALLTAWASWVGSLHGGNQATNYTTSNNLASEGNSEYNAGMQSMMQDMLLWNEVSDLQIDLIFAQENGDELAEEQIANKLFYKLNDNLSENMANAIGWEFQNEGNTPLEIINTWMAQETALASPFGNPEFVEMYFESANELLAKSEEVMKKGESDNKYGDAFGLVTVVYGVVLFLLGIAGSFKNKRNEYVVIAISLVSFLLATIYMLTIPMPTGFSLASFFVS